MRFKEVSIGDRVELNWDMLNRVDSGPGFFPGIAGTVVALCEGLDDVGVRWDFDEPDRACHSLEGNCEDGYGWWVPPEALLPFDDVSAAIDQSKLLTLLGG